MSTIIREPIYKQVGSRLRELIQSDEYQAGDRFLSEREVADRFEISRITANKAIAALVGEGLLEHRRGIGNFVRPAVLGYDLCRLVSFTEKARMAGLLPSTKLIKFERQILKDADELMAETLDAAPDEELFVIERVRQVSDKPVIYEKRWVRANRCPNLSVDDASGSLYQAFTSKYALPLTGTQATLQAVNLGQKEANLLATEPNAAAFFLTAVGFSGISLWYEETLYRGDSYEVTHVLGGVVGSISLNRELTVKGDTSQ